MPVLFPLNIYTLDSKPCSRKVENRYDKTWLEKWPECAPIVLYTKQNGQGGDTGGQNTAHYKSVMESNYSKNGHVPRLNFYFSFVIYSRINIFVAIATL